MAETTPQNNLQWPGLKGEPVTVDQREYLKFILKQTSVILNVIFPWSLATFPRVRAGEIVVPNDNIP
jgi:hypothetical protein